MNRKDMKKQYSLRKIGKYVGSVVIGLSFAAVMNSTSTEVQAAQQPPSAESVEFTDEVNDEGITTVVTDNKTAEDIPFETKYIADDAMELNTKKEVTPGKPGSKAFKNKVFYNFNTGKTKILERTPEKVIITEPTTQVIKVGTKPTVVTEKIESSIKYIKDPNRPIGSDVITESEGEDGIKKITTTYVLDEKTGKVTVKENTTTIEKKAQDIVYKVGAQDKIQETTINHKTIYEKDDNLEVRTRKVKTPGENGKIVTTTSYSVSPINGTPTPNTPIEKRTEPKTEVITIGTKPTVRVEEIESEEVKFEKDLEHQKGSNPETIPGENGTKEITTTYKLDTNTGEVSELETTEKILTQPTPTVVKVPAKDKIEHKDIPIEAEYEADPTLEKGKKVDDPNRQGKLGIRTITTTYRIENGKAVEDTSTEKVTTPMEKKIIKVGTKPTVRVGDIESKEVKFEKDLEHPRGSNPETIPGENGTKEITTTYKLDTNTGEVSELETTEKILTQPTPTVVKVPAKDKVEKRIAEKSTNIRFEKDETRDRNENPVTIDGEDGYVTTTTTYDVDSETGKVTEKVTVEKKEATDTVIKVPAKSKVEREVLPTSVIRFEKDETKDRSENPITTDGEDGYVTTTRTYDVNPENGHVTEKVTVDRKEATDTVIKVPAKSKVEREVLPTSVIRYEKDESRDRGASIEMIDGEDGYVTTTRTYDVNPENGKVSETVTVDRKEATDTVIKVPAKSKVDREVLPTSVIRYEKDETRDRGASIEMVDGEDGYVTTTTTYDVNPETGKVSETVTVDRKEATDTVIKVPAKSKVDREVLPTSVIRYEKDETRDRGASIEMVDGEDGYVTTTTTYDVNPETGKVSEKVTVDRKESTDTVIKVPAKSKVEREVLPTSVIRYEKDESRDRGASIEMVDGEDGYVTTTRTYDVNPETGKVSEKVTVDRKEATDTVIKVPAKSKVEEVLVPFATKYEADNDLSAGQEQEITLGKNGKTVTTITYDVDGKSGQVTESTLSQKEDSQTRVVKKGTKPQVLVQEIPIETEYLDDSTLDKGQEIEEAGEIGEITLTTIYTVDERDGTIEETTSRQITKEMVKRRIRRGTREPEKVVVPKKSSIPSYPVSVTSNQGTDSALEPAKPVAATTGWKQENGMWYFYNTNGSMVTGWVQVNGSWYYLNSNGSMATGWAQVNGSWYYLNDNGSMETGWLQNNGSWYYLNSNGSMKANQWFQVGSKWYYVNASGELAINTSIDGYRVNDNGEWVR
ncbi:PspC-related protein choline-binding protein 1 [Streptococcus pseudopneumoniae]|uniref:PspC-related protein choline-binding protein 1 n=2 Tax=Streptococcus pseudopneumoniae TaxID=257758 RepID=UPI001C657974|nr:PspC-related protein choline-binding protein 1 [Streptococcus pseudopneumoniae]MBW8119257.1 PspC-related protein choline-binding protein 1 [Streptococcus pseudopneumoniae]